MDRPPENDPQGTIRQLGIYGKGRGKSTADLDNRNGMRKRPEVGLAAGNWAVIEKVRRSVYSITNNHYGPERID